MSLKNWNFFKEKSEFLRDISISLKTVVRRGLPNAYPLIPQVFKLSPRIRNGGVKP